MNQEELLQKAKENLPDEYVAAVKALGVASRVDSIRDDFELSDAQTAFLDQEVVYLLLHITNSPEFTERLAEKLDVSDRILLQIIKAVTNKVLEPFKNSVAGVEGAAAASMPVPPPPPVPGSGYGGTSDPYREPTDRN